MCGTGGLGEVVSAVHEDGREVQLEGYLAQQAHRPAPVSGRGWRTSAHKIHMYYLKASP